MLNQDVPTKIEIETIAAMLAEVMGDGPILEDDSTSYGLSAHAKEAATMLSDIYICPARDMVSDFHSGKKNYQEVTSGIRMLAREAIRAISLNAYDLEMPDPPDFDEMDISPESFYGDSEDVAL